MLPALAFIFGGAIVAAVYNGLLGYIVGGLGIFLGIVLLIVITNKILRSDAQLLMDEKGIDDHRLKTGCIPWEDINAVSLEETRHARWLTIELESPEKYYSKLPVVQLILRKLNGQEGMNDLRIRFNDLDGSIDDAFEYVRKMKESLNPDIALKP